MIADHITNAPNYYALGEKFQAAMEHLSSFDYLSAKPGRIEIAEGVFALVQQYDTLPREELKWEAHKKYIDIQYIVSGREDIGYASIKELEAVTEYDESGDCLLLAGSGSTLQMREGMFAIFAPEDAHMPCIAAGNAQNVKKVVVKVAV